MEIVAAALTVQRLGPKHSRYSELMNQNPYVFGPRHSRIREYRPSGSFPAVEPFPIPSGLQNAHRHIALPVLSAIAHRWRGKNCVRNDDKIKEIASLLHFENPYHFSKSFKQKAGKSPVQSRATYRSGERQ